MHYIIPILPGIYIMHYIIPILSGVYIMHYIIPILSGVYIMHYIIPILPGVYIMHYIIPILPGVYIMHYIIPGQSWSVPINHYFTVPQLFLERGELVEFVTVLHAYYRLKVDSNAMLMEGDLKPPPRCFRVGENGELK